MASPFHLQDELQALSDLSTYEIPSNFDFQSDDPRVLLAEAVSTTASSPLSIVDEDLTTFNIYRSLLKHADVVPGPVMSKLLDSISSGLPAGRVENWWGGTEDTCR
jgi:condensin complex subunit 1